MSGSYTLCGNYTKSLKSDILNNTPFYKVVPLIPKDKHCTNFNTGSGHSTINIIHMRTRLPTPLFPVIEDKPRPLMGKETGRVV